MEFSGQGRPLSDSGMQSALEALGLSTVADMPILWSVLTVESRGFGFTADRRPKILFERHIFFRETDGRFASSHPDLCAERGGGYIGGTAEYARLNRAIEACKQAGLGPEPALRSASWGLGQVMGFNAREAGFANVTDMVTQMRESESAQLIGMVNFMKSKRLDRKLRQRDWAGFAAGYNGSTYWKHQYDVKLSSAFEKFSSGINRDLKTRMAQGGLLFLDYRPGDPDGVLGQNTRSAIAAFKKDMQLGSGDALDSKTFKAIMQRVGWV